MHPHLHSAHAPGVLVAIVTEGGIHMDGETAQERETRMLGAQGWNLGESSACNVTHLDPVRLTTIGRLFTWYRTVANRLNKDELLADLKQTFATPDSEGRSRGSTL